MRQRLFLGFVWLFISLFLVGCGADSAEQSSGDNGDAGVDGSTTSISLRLLEANPGDPNNPQEISQISSDTPGEVVATLEDGSGVALANEVVEFSSTIGTLNPTSGTALTNSEGEARITLKAGTTPGAGTLSATVSLGNDGGDGDDAEASTQASLGFETLGDGTDDTGGSLGTDVSLQLLNNNDTAISQISSDQEGTLRATVTDRDGDPAAQEVVTFSSSLANILPADGTALTDSQGIAEATLTAGSVAGAGTATATFSGASDQVSFKTAGDEGGGVSQGANLSLSLSSTDIRSDATGTLTATLTRNGEPLQNRFISVTTQSAVTTQSVDVSLSPSSGTKLTDANGEAEFTILPEDEFGAGLIQATADLQGNLVNQSINFEITQADIRLGGFTDPFANGDARGFIEEALETSLDGTDDNLEADNSLSAGGSLTVTASIIDTDGDLFEPADGPIDVSFTSNCVNDGDATIDSPVQATGGVATATYTDNGCAGQDSITASADIGSETLTGVSTFNVEASAAGSIEFIDADPQTISLEGTGGQGRLEVSTVSFIVRDENSQPVRAQEVNFALSTDVGDLTLNQASKQTNQNGEVSVRVQAGTIPTAVRVEASFVRPDGTEISTVSDQLIVSTGLPDDDSFSLSVDRFNPGDAFNVDGRESEVSIRAADHFNNPVPDGTAIAFETEGGAIESSCTTTDGVCTVTWTSQDPRPVRDELKTNPNDRFGRAMILATAVGEESFTDVNGNGRFDVDETQGIASDDPFDDLAEAFRDDNEDGSRTTNGQEPNGTVFIEEFKDFNRNGAFTDADGFYNGTLCTDDAEAQGHCGDLVNVRGQSVIVMPTREIFIRLRSAGSSLLDFNIPSGEQGVRSCTLELDGSDLMDSDFELGGDGGVIERQSFDLWFRDANCNAVPNGTQISLSTNKGVLSGETNFEVGSTTEPVKRTYTIREENPDGPTALENGEITIEATNDESDTSETLVIPIKVDEPQ